ncbi:uncharacterized protein LOC135491004 isoform X1 [Lineus longissimus]|uniref:uncharacterized protein LOC135491004 isoform X1 n=1 Tax=Lineus longissimus TaxID=88925 RepID=UPI00315C8489
MRGSSAANLQVAGIRKVSGSDQYDHQSRTQKMSVQRLHDDYLEGITEDSSNKQRFLSSELVKNTLSSNILKTESVNVSNANVSEFSEHGNVPNLDPSIPRLSNELKGWYVPAVSGITNSQSEDVKVLPASSFDPDHSVMSMLSCHSNQSPILKVEAEANSSSSFACSNKVLPSPPTVKVAQDRSFPARALPSTCSPVASAGSEGSTYCPFASACFQDSAHCPVMSAVVQGLAHSPVTSSGFQDLALPKVLADKVSRCRISLPSANVKQQSVPSDIRKPGEPCGQSELSHRKPPQSRRYYKKMVSVGVQCRCLFIPLIKTEPLDSDNEVSPAVSSNLGSRRRLSDNDNVPDHGVMSDDSRRNIMCESEIGFIGVLPSKQRDNNASMRSLSDDVSGKGSKMNEQISGPVIRDFGSKRFSEHSTPMIVDPAHGDVGSELDTVGLEMDVSCDDLTDGESSGLGEILDADSFGDDSLANMLGDASRIGRPSFHENEGDAISEATTIVKSEEVSPKSSSCEKRKILSGSTQGEVVKEPPAKRKRGRPPGRKVAQSFQVVENEKEISSGSGLDKLAPGDVLKETPARRKRGRPPGRKIAQSFQVVENEKEISSGSGLDKLAPGDVLKETPARRKRGRPPGRKIAQSFQVVENKKEITSGSGLDKLAPGDVLKETPARRKRGRPPGKKVELSFQVVENKKEITSGSGLDKLAPGDVLMETPARRKRGRKIAQSFQVVENEKEISSGSGLDKLAPGDVLKETPARRKRGRPPGKKIAQSFQVVENEKEISSGSGLDKLAPGDVLKETPARRKRGRPPGRKIAQSFQVVENEKEISSGSGLDKLAPGDVLKETPARRKRGQPPGRKIAQSFQVVENEKEISSGSGPDELDEEGLQPVILQSGRKRFGCQHCSKCFSTAIQCSLHEKEAHVLLTCDECAETFSCEAEVQKHYNLKHKGKYVRFSKEIPEGESDDNFEVPDDIESSSASDNDYVDPEYVDKQEEGEDLDDALSQHKTSSASMRKRRKGMMDKRNHNSVTKVVCKCGRTYQKNHAKRHLETRMHKSFEDARKLKIKDRGNETSLHKSFEDARKLKIKKLRKRREGIRKVCSKIKSLLQRKQLAPSTQSTSTYVYCLKVKETTFNNCIKGFVQLKQELTSKEQRKLQKELQENLEEIHKRVRENVSYQSEEALDNGELSNAESLEDSTGITRDNQLSSCTGSANNGNQIGTRVANRSQLSDFIADTSGQLNPVANSSDQQSPGIFDTSDKLFCCTAGASDYLHVSTSTHLANSSGQLSQDMGNNSDTLGTCNVVASDKLSADNADTSVKPSDNGESCDSRSDAYTCMSDKLENSGNSANYPEDCDSKDDTNPSFLVDFFRCEVFRHCLSKSKKRGKERPSGFLFNVIFDSLEKETLFPISEKLYNSLRVCLHHRYHEMCPIGKKENLSVGSKISDVWAGHLDTRDIDRDGVLQMLGKIDYSSKISVDSWKIVKPMEKGKDFCYSLLVVDKTHKNKHRIVSDGVTGFLLTQQEITDLSSVESLIKKSLKQFDIFHRRFSHTITTSPDKLRTEQNVGDLAEAQRGEKGMTLVQEERCIAGKTAISGICPQGGEEDSSEKGRGKSTTNSETSTVDPADTRDSEHRPEEMMVSADDTSVLDIDYSVTLSKYCKCCYIECMKRSQRTRRYCFSFNFSSISIDGNNLDDITLKIYKSLLVTRFRGIFLNNFFTVAQMKEVIQNLWDNKCDISVPELLLMYKVREKGLFWCDECQVTLANEVEVAKHLGQSCHLISGQSNKLCPICGKSFKGNILFLRHRITKHHHAVLLPLMPGAIKRCPHCQKPFYNSTALNRHIQYVHQGTNTKPVEPVEPVEPVLCNECGKLLQTKEGVVKHKRWHYNEKKRMSSGVIPCPYCSKTVRACKFCQHLETHENTKQYCCEICKKRFKIKCALTMHMKIHSDVREFTCPECGQEFRHKAHMQSHLRRHTGDLFECQLCERTFTIKTNLKIHLRKRHPEHQKAEIYTCKFCCEEFMRLTDLNRHIDVEHMSSSKAGDSDRIDKPTTSLDGRLFECNHCNKKFAKKYYLRKHICSAHQDGVNDKNNVKSSRTQKLDKVIKDKKAVKIKMLKSAEVSFDKDGNVTKRKRETAGKKQRKCNMPNDGAPRNTEEKKLAKRKVSETRGS